MFSPPGVTSGRRRMSSRAVKIELSFLFNVSRSLVEFTLEKYGKLDFLVNNGGGQFPCGAADMSLKGWNAVIETNLTGTYLMCREAHRQYMGENGGSIVNIIADMFRGFPMMSHTGK